MIQTTLNVPLEVKPESAAWLASLVERFKEAEDKPDGGASDNFSRLSAQVPCLHFLSMSVFESEQYDPLFLIEANFDGAPGPFWAQLEALAGETLRDMLRCCREPLDDDAALFRRVTEPRSREPVAPYLEARTELPSVFHHGNRGLSRDRIRADAGLFRALRAELDAPENQGPEPYRGEPPARIHERLRARMIPSHPWLDEPAPVRVSGSQRASDIARLLGIAMVIVFLLSLPGIILALLLPREIYVGAICLLALLALSLGYSMRRPLEGTAVETPFSLVTFLGRNAVYALLVLAAIVLGIIGVAVGLAWAVDLATGLIPGGVGTWWREVAQPILLGQLSLIFIVPGLVAWLRYLEVRDSTRHAPRIDEEIVSAMARREDWIPQNHMVSIVNIRPGVLRTFIVRLGHATLGRLLRVTATDGYLGSMRTVHFAHWAFQNNGSRLVFFSNFDQSWGSYLDDFIEKAHVGLTLAWGCGVGFPPTRFLIYDGASHGRLFKTWALASRTVTRFWYSAYPDLSVDQIERNHRIANGLRRKAMNDGESRIWMRDL